MMRKVSDFGASVWVPAFAGTTFMGKRLKLRRLYPTIRNE
jgi:hypothetical protein